jgi:4'-phosphopantetheinyl transferase EntD
MIERLLPAVVATAETRQELLDVDLFSEEERSVGNAVQKRRHEFVSGRACARQALQKFGIAPVAIPNGERGEPLWPNGVVGSITHCLGYRAAAVARASEMASLGIDAEPNEPLPDGILQRIAFGREQAMVAGARHAGDPGDAVHGGAEPVHLDRLLFCAKEAIYKAWYPLTRRWLGFEDVELAIDEPGQSFCGRLLVEGPLAGTTPLTELRGRWCVEEMTICAAAFVPLPPRNR